MAKSYESKRNSARTSPSVAKLVRMYGHYVVRCIIEKKHIQSLAQFYYENIHNEVPRSRIYEAHLRSSYIEGKIEREMFEDNDEE